MLYLVTLPVCSTEIRSNYSSDRFDMDGLSRRGQVGLPNDTGDTATPRNRNAVNVTSSLSINPANREANVTCSA